MIEISLGSGKKIEQLSRAIPIYFRFMFQSVIENVHNLKNLGKVLIDVDLDKMRQTLLNRGFVYEFNQGNDAHCFFAADRLDGNINIGSCYPEHKGIKRGEPANTKWLNLFERQDLAPHANNVWLLPDHSKVVRVSLGDYVHTQGENLGVISRGLAWIDFDTLLHHGPLCYSFPNSTLVQEVREILDDEDWSYNVQVFERKAPERFWEHLVENFDYYAQDSALLVTSNLIMGPYDSGINFYVEDETIMEKIKISLSDSGFHYDPEVRFWFPRSDVL